MAVRLANSAKNAGILLSCFFLFTPSPPAFSQIISVFAGITYSPGYSGDGGPATAAKLKHPDQLAEDGAGNIYIADFVNDRIRKVDACGIITTVAGNDSAGYNGDGIAATAAWLNDPSGIAVDVPHQLLYICDQQNHRIRMVNAAGIITTVAGNGVPGAGGDGGPATAAQLGSITTIAVDPRGNLYICDEGVPTPTVVTMRIRKVDTLGIITTFAGNGTTGFSGDGGPATAAQLNTAGFIAFDVYNNAFITDADNNRVRKVDTGGIITTIAGTGVSGFFGDGGPAAAAELNGPEGIFVDDSENIYIADYFNNRIREINASGIITTIAGTGGAFVDSGDGGPAIAAGLYYPYSLIWNTRGNIFFSSYFPANVRVFGNIINHPPAFTGGHTLNFNACEDDDIDAINALLAVTDSDIGQTETWSLLTGPVHGVAAAAYSATISGVSLTPSGLYYTPAAGFTGADSFRVLVTDCRGGADTATVRITILPLPAAGAITGKDTVCTGDTIMLADTVAGGTWASSNSAISAVTGSGIATGITPGTDTIFYAVTASGCTAAALLPVTVLSHAVCATGVTPIPAPGNSDVLTTWPNPCSGIFTLSIRSSYAADARIVITNMLGEKMKEIVTATNDPLTIQLDAPAGVYFLSAVTEEGKYNTKVIVTK